MFSDELIEKICTAKRRTYISQRGGHYLGCDVARMDRDEFTYEIFDKINSKMLVHIENIVTKNIPIPQSVRKIIALNEQYKETIPIDLQPFIGQLSIIRSSLEKHINNTKFSIDCLKTIKELSQISDGLNDWMGRLKYTMNK